MIQSARQPQKADCNDDGEPSPRRDDMAAPCAIVASRGNLAFHRSLFIGPSGRILNPKSVQTFLDTAKAPAGGRR
jgi:hypothetical protein